MLPSFLYILDPASFDKARKAQDLNFIPGTILFPFLVNVTKGWWCTLDWVEVELQIYRLRTLGSDKGKGLVPGQCIPAILVHTSRVNQEEHRAKVETVR